MEQFVNKYSLTKTLRFELKPIGKTLEHIQNRGFIIQDETRASEYDEVKEIIDRYHRWFIDLALSGASLNVEKLSEYEQLYWKEEKSDTIKAELAKKRSDLRKELVKFFKYEGEAGKRWKNLFKQELLKKDLPEFVGDNEEERKLLNNFRNFTTYFNGFHENRENMYSDKEQSTAIAYRLIHDNLSKFLDNRKIFQSICSNHPKFNPSSLEADLAEVLEGRSLDSIFDLGFFNSTLTQSGIDRYNTILGGIAEERQVKIKGINEYINLYRQKEKLKPKQLPNLKPLYKQILSDRISASWLPEEFKTDQELLNGVSNFYQQLCAWKKNEHEVVNLFEELSDLLSGIGGENYDLNKIFVKNNGALSTISSKTFGSWSIINDALAHYYETEINSSSNQTKAYQNNKEKWLTRSHFSLSEIDIALVNYKNHNDDLKLKCTTACPISDYFRKLGNERKVGDSSVFSFVHRIQISYEEVAPLLNFPYSGNKKLNQDKEKVAHIKQFLDDIIGLLHFVKALHPSGLEQDKEEGFYANFLSAFDQLNLVTPLYNKVRNYITKKPYTLEKIKINFDNGTLLSGWDINKETSNTSIILRKNDNYYLGIMDKAHNHAFVDVPDLLEGEDTFEKMIYKQLGDIKKQLPRIAFSRAWQDLIDIPEDVLHIKESESFKSNVDDCNKLIAYYKSFINNHEEWNKYFNFQFTHNNNYQSVHDFYSEVENQFYSLSFRKISAEYVYQLVNEGKLYLFQIYNKDFSPFSKGKPNLHTLYWRMTFDQRNLENIIYKLNGQAEIFFRRKSLEYSENILKSGHHAEKLKGKFSYPIISNRRFAFDKFQFHVPLTLNFKAVATGDFNSSVLSFLRNNQDISIIGIDRGERHLLYVTLIDQQGNIKEQLSLNEIVNSYKDSCNQEVQVRTDYRAKLHDKEIERDDRRKAWGTIENIKELKEGYLSHVVHKIAQLMVENNAIVVMEDLNVGFKRGRQKVEKQVYQKFEKMLIDKLNYLVFKERRADEVGGVLKALQLSSKFTSFKDMQKQSGFLFYVPPFLTSKIDPTTGFVDLLKPKYESVEKSKEFFAKFDAIKFNKSEGYFEFEFDYNQFPEILKNTEDAKTHWVACTAGSQRCSWNGVERRNELCDVTGNLKALFERNSISYVDGNCTIEQILKQEEKSFFLSLIKSIATTLSLRHTYIENGLEKDFILSPVKNNNGKFFNSLEANDNEPQNADANGAYHIALKGLWILNKVNESDDLSRIKLVMSNKDWLKFAQEVSQERTIYSADRKSNNAPLSLKHDGELYSNIVS